jgi:hypothetical protein
VSVRPPTKTLADVLSVLHEYGWAQEPIDERSGAVCLLTSINLACGAWIRKKREDGLFELVCNEEVDDDDLEAIRDLYEESCCRLDRRYPGLDSIAVFNDDPDTTFPDVVALLS